MKQNRKGWGLKGMALGFLIGGLGWTPAQAAETPAEAEVRQAMTELVSAAARLDAAAILARLDQDPAARFYVQGQAFNYTDLATFLKDSFADLKSQKINWLESTARELAPDTVLWTSSGRNPVEEASGREVEYMLGETWVWKKSADAWKAIHYSESFLEMPSREKCAQVQAALTAFAATFKIESQKPEDVLPALEGFLRTQENVLGSAFAFVPRAEENPPAAYVFRRGGEYIRKLETFGAGYAQAEWYAKPAASGQPTWSNPYFDTYGGQKMMITCSLPLFDPQGVLQGVLTADMPLY